MCVSLWLHSPTGRNDLRAPDAHRAKPILVRVDGAGFCHNLIDHLAAAGLDYSVGFPTNAVSSPSPHSARRSMP